LTLSVDQVLSEPVGLPAPEAATDKHWPCNDVVVATYNNRTDLIGEVYTGPDATGDFQYSTEGTTTVSIGVSASGSYGSFSSSGSATVTAKASIDYPTVGNNGLKVWQTEFQWKKIYEEIYTDYGCQSTGYEVRPSAWEGDQSGYNAASAPTANYCSTAYAGSTTSKDSSNAITFSNGAKLGSVIGIDLSSKTGFTSKAKIVFKWQRAGRLCGTNTYWPDANRVVGKG
jgi:hypothetical protein